MQLDILDARQLLSNGTIPHVIVALSVFWRHATVFRWRFGAWCDPQTAHESGIKKTLQLRQRGSHHFLLFGIAKEVAGFIGTFFPMHFKNLIEHTYTWERKRRSGRRYKNRSADLGQPSTAICVRKCSLCEIFFEKRIEVALKFLNFPLILLLVVFFLHRSLMMQRKKSSSR